MLTHDRENILTFSFSFFSLANEAVCDDRTTYVHTGLELGFRILSSICSTTMLVQTEVKQAKEQRT